MSTQLYTYDQNDLMALCNQVKEMTISDLVTQKIISDEDAKVFLKKRVLFAYKPSIFGKVWMKLNGVEDDKGKINLAFTDLTEN